MGEVENVELVRKLYDVMGRPNLEGLAELVTADVELVVPGPPQLPMAGVWRGISGVQQCLQTLRQAQENLAMEFLDFVADGDTVVVRLHAKARVHKTGRVFESDIVHFFKIRDGRIALLQDFLDTHAVVDAFDA